MIDLKFWNKISEEKRFFYIFLIIHFLVWSGIGLIRTVLPTDSLEGIYWGQLHDFGTPKHPPLAGWLTYLAYTPFKKDIFVYMLSQACIVCGFVYIYKLAKCFLDENKAMLSVILLEGCWCYSYITGYYGFNPDVILLMILPIIAFCFYNCMHSDKPKDWLCLGLLVGISFLNKYQTGLLILAMLIWALMFKRSIFKSKWFYISIAIAFVIFLPHLIWLFKYDFFPFLYFERELTATSWLNHILAPLQFFIVQIAAIAGTLVIFAILRIKNKLPLKLTQSYDKQDVWFLLLLGLLPLAVHVVMGLFEGGTMRPRWGFEFLFMTSIMLFYFFPQEISKKDFKLGLKSAYVIMLIVFLSLGTLLSVEKNYRSRYPVAPVMKDLNERWAKEVSTPLKYVGGYIEWTLPLTIYGENHPKAILDTFGYSDPWISVDERKKAGVLVIDRHIYELQKDTLKACPYLHDDYKITPQEYSFSLTNALGKERIYTVYYTIIPPIND